MAKRWFTYMGTGSVLSPANYILSTEKPTCINGRIVCSIYSNDIGNMTPGGFSENIITYIATGRATGLPQPINPIGSKKYVYFLPMPG